MSENMQTEEPVLQAPPAAPVPPAEGALAAAGSGAATATVRGRARRWCGPQRGQRAAACLLKRARGTPPPPADQGRREGRQHGAEAGNACSPARQAVPGARPAPRAPHPALRAPREAQSKRVARPGRRCRPLQQSGRPVCRVAQRARPHGLIAPARKNPARPSTPPLRPPRSRPSCRC